MFCGSNKVIIFSLSLCLAGSILRQAFASWRQGGSPIQCESLKVKSSGKREDLLSPNLRITAIGLKTSNYTRDRLTYSSLALGMGWQPKEFGKLLQEEEGVDAGWPGTPVDAHHTHTGGMGLRDILFSWYKAQKGHCLQRIGLALIWLLEDKGIPLSGNSVDHSERPGTLRSSVTFGRG